MNVDVKIAKIMANQGHRCSLIELLSILNKFNFSKNFKVITITGTNGKGTTVAMLEELFIANNKKVLSHTSPHIFKFNERICLNKEPIKDSILCNVLEKISKITSKYHLTYHQIAFLCACIYSQMIKIDYLILEVGLGGRLDAANIIDADFTAITNIDYDHCEVLGNSLEKIGAEKVAISRCNTPLFLGSKMPNSVYKYAKTIGAIIFDKTFKSNYKNCFQHSYNIAMSLANYLLKKDEITYIPRLDNIRAKARFNILKNDKPNNNYVVVDVAHNPASVELLFKLLKNEFGSKNIKYQAIFGILGSKDIANILSIAKHHIHKWNVIDLKFLDERASDIKEIKQQFKQQNIIKADFDKDLNKIHLADKDTVVVVFGSFVLAGEFIKQYEKNN